MEHYNILDTVGNDGKVSVKRLSDGLLSRCKPGWLTPIKETPGVFKARSKTKAIRLDGLDWATEE